MDKKISEKQIDQIISRIDNLDEEDLTNEFIRLNPNSRDEFLEIFYKAVDQTPEERHASISSSIHKGLLKKKPPITSMLQYFKTIYYNIDRIRDIIISKDVHISIENESYTITANLLEFEARIFHLRSMINTLVLDIEKGYDAIITVEFNNSKELLLKEFNGFISNELSKSRIHDERKNIRLQKNKKLRQYLKVWELKNAGIKIGDISIIVNEKEPTVKKQFRRAFELIYDCKYSKDKFIEQVIRRGNRKKCDYCPKKPTCKELCEEVKKDVDSHEKYLREKLGGNKSVDNVQMEFDDILSDDNLDFDNEIDQDTSSS